MIRLKAIVPAKLNNVFQAEMAKTLKDVGKGIEKDFQRTQSTWSHKADFRQEDHTTGSPMSTEVYTEDEIYTYVNEGTKPHPIYPRTPGGMLAFQGTYSAKTMPGVIDARAGGKSGDMVYAHGVQHPGTDARKFDEAIAKEWEDTFPEMVQEALDSAAAKSGHGL